MKKLVNFILVLISVLQLEANQSVSNTVSKKDGPSYSCMYKTECDGYMKNCKKSLHYYVVKLQPKSSTVIVKDSELPAQYSQEELNFKYSMRIYSKDKQHVISKEYTSIIYYDLSTWLLSKTSVRIGMCEEIKPAW